MQRRGVRTLVIWLIAAALAAGWWWLRGSAASHKASAAEPVPLFAGSDAIPVDAIDVVTLERGGEPTIEMRRVNGHWRQVAPFEVDLDEWSARQLVVDAAAAASVRDVGGDASNAGQLGFAPPAAKLSMQGGGRSWALEFGKRGVAGRAFARRPGAAIHVIDGGLYERAVEADSREWRSRQLFPESLGRPQQFTYELNDTLMQIDRTGEHWSISSPHKTRADQQRIGDLIAGLARARSDGFIADAPKDLAPYGLATPAARMTITFQTETGQATRTLWVGSQLGVGSADRYGQIEDTATVMRLSAATLASLFPGELSLIERTGSGVRPADVKRFEVRPVDGDAFECVRDLDRWTAARIVNGKTGPALPCANELPEQLLKELCIDQTTNVKLISITDELKVADVLLYGFDARPLDVVRIGHDKKTGLWGLENGDGVTRLFPATTKFVLSADEYGLPR